MTLRVSVKRCPFPLLRHRASAQVGCRSPVATLHQRGAYNTDNDEVAVSQEVASSLTSIHAHHICGIAVMKVAAQWNLQILAPVAFPAVHPWMLSP